jgi:hypothetical protein
LPKKRLQAIQSHLERCAACRQRVAEIHENAKTYDEDSAQRLEQLQRRLREESRSPAGEASWAVIARRVGIPAVITAAVVLAVILGVRLSREPPISFRGRLSVQVIAKRGEEQFVVQEGQQLREGDALRFVVTTATGGFVSIFSVDGRGKVSPFYPASDPSTAAAPLELEEKGRHVLPGSIILDDAPGPESIVAVFARRTFSRKEVHRRAKQQIQKSEARRLRARDLGIQAATQVVAVERRSGASE